MVRRNIARNLKEGLGRRLNRGLGALALAGLLALAPHNSTRAQELAALVADAVRVDAGGQLIADGGVEVFYQGRTLRAEKIVYDRTADRLTITGPIVLIDGDDAILIASQAELSADLTEGVLQSARLVLNRELQLAATQIQRIGGRYTQLDNVVASSCKVCEGNPTPLWEIRARRVVHDQQERQIYFDHAQFRVAGVPIAWFPRLRMPDPTLKRTSGFLMPTFRTTSSLGPGLKLPYFLTIGDSRDLTITPYVSTKDAQSVDLRYRQAFRTGEIDVSGAVSRDRILPGQTRYYLNATGAFNLPRDFTLAFRGEVVSDPAYLLDYGLPAKDRLDSRIEVTRTRRNEYISGRLIGFDSVRAREDNATLPSMISDFTLHRRFSGGIFGGEAGLRFQTHSHKRSSANPLDLDLDGFADGRDVARASLRLDYRRNWVLPSGMIGTALGEVKTDAYSVAQDAVYAGNTARLHGGVAVELRWPWAKAGAKGVGHVIEPVMQVVWSPSGTEKLQNEDSALVEFDQGNLFSLNRSPGSDMTERGGRVNLGVGYTRVDPAGWTVSGTVGRVLRADDPNQFSAASGLDGRNSDWLAALQLTLPDGLGLTHRMLLDGDLGVTKSESQLNIARAGYAVAGSYTWVVADADENRVDSISELALDGSYSLTDAWTARGQARYDFQADRANRAGVGLQYRNECVAVDLSLSRRFTSSTSVKPTTDFGLTVELAGFGGGATAGPSRQCRR
jgi:LPS-assembly protein